jgi:hypothetical protein
MAGALLRGGGAPYVAYWDHKPPLIHLINALGLAIGGGRIWGIWALTLAAFLAALVLGHLAMRRAFGPLAAALGTTYFAACLAYLAPLNLPEGYVLPVQWGAVLLLTAARPAEERRHAYVTGLALGALGATAGFLKPTFVGAAGSVALVLTWTLLSSRRTGDWLRLIAGAVAGGLLVVLPILGFLAARGSLGAFADQVLHYNAVYVQASTLRRLRAGYRGLTDSGLLFLPGTGWLLAAYRLWRRGRADPRHAVLLLAVVWLPIEVLLDSFSGRYFPYNYALLYAPFALLAAYVAVELASAGEEHADPQRHTWARRVVAGIVLSLAVASAGNMLRATAPNSNGNAPGRDAHIAQTVAYLRSHTPPGAPIFVWGHAAYLYLFADRPPASHFIYSLPLLTPGYVDSAVARRFVDELRANAPAAIVDASGPMIEGGYTPPLGRWDPGWGYPDRADDRGGSRKWWAMPPALRGFYDYVAENYVVADSVGPAKWAVYVRRDRAGPPP